ncbi:MAG: site-2 protease family protein, partial [Thermoplasmata archaeon]
GLESLACIVGTLGFYNIVLAMFNMLPAFPMDGGRVLRALLAVFTTFKRATSIAADIGKGFSLAMGVFGFFTGSFWLILLAVFLFLAATGEEKATNEFASAEENGDRNKSDNTSSSPGPSPAGA